jgi:phenylacetic acid degradation operon negative regulatory protein
VDDACNLWGPPPSAPDLLLDLLAANGGSLSVQALCRSGVLIGIGESAIRVGLTRLTCEQKIIRSGRGTYSFNRAKPGLAHALDDWQHKEGRTIEWNRDWIAVHGTTVLRSDKTVWRHHNLALALRGFAEFKPGLHIRPNNLVGGPSAICAELLELGLSPEALVCRIADLDHDQQRAACALWDMQALSAEYGRWIAALESSRQTLHTKPQELALREALLLGRAAIAYLIRDPMLPVQLMSPAPRMALVEVALRYQEEGRQRWQAWLALPPT